MVRTLDDKFRTVIEKNTFYFFNRLKNGMKVI